MSGLPSGLPDALEGALERRLGRGVRIRAADPLSGGCVNPSARITTDGGDRFFVKWNAGAPPGMFAAEADGLSALAEAGGLRVPEVIATGADAVRQWLLLEYIEPGRPGRDYARRLGEGLAALHRAASGEGWGWRRDNFLGPLPQSNRRARSWGELWRDARLGPQLEAARGRGSFAGATGALLERAVERAPELLADIAEPSLLHGDLWGGNVFADGAGRPVVIDPAVYRGHREVDLAMSELFGGFPPGWPRAYDAAWPIEPGYEDVRRPLYQLYYLLVHVNLFGAGYEPACIRAAREALRA